MALEVHAPTIRLLLVDDHMVVRAGLVQVLGAVPDIEIVGAVASGEEALVLCQQLRPDVVLMDVRMAGIGGVGTAEVIARYHPGIRILALSTFTDEATVAAMTRAGAVGFLPKTVSGEELAEAIRAVHAGRPLASPDAGHAKMDHAGGPAAANGETPMLGQQQRRVLALLTKGYTNTEIAGYLGISMPTARYHVSAILLKLGVSNRAEAAALAVREGLVGQADF